MTRDPKRIYFIKGCVAGNFGPHHSCLHGPWITRRWQEQQRESEIEVAIVGKISGLVMNTVMTIYLFNAGRLSKNNDKYFQDNELELVYKQWRVDTCVIGSKLHAYFPDPEKGDAQIHKQWRRFSDHLTHYYESGRATDCNTDQEHLLRAKDKLFAEKAVLIEDILRSRVTGFRPRAEAT
jgi:hypothetical protein